MQGARRGFTLIELLMVTAILALLAAVVVPAVFGTIAMTRRAICASNLHNLGSAARQYLVHSGGRIFPIEEPAADAMGRPGKLWYFGFESEESRMRPEGTRELDKTRARLYRYCGSYNSLELCPAFDFRDPAYKPKFRTPWWNYGANASVCLLNAPHLIEGLPNMDEVILFADSAQVNYWQAPASPRNPMYEEWHLVARNKRFIHFRHDGQANVLTLSGAVRVAEPEPGSFDPWLPAARIGRLVETEQFCFWPP